MKAVGLLSLRDLLARSQPLLLFSLSVDRVYLSLELRRRALMDDDDRI